MIRPLGERILITRLEGHGIETVSKGGIVIPATAEKSVRTKADYFRARVEALGPDVVGYELAAGDEVLVYTYSGTAETVFTGEGARGASMFVRAEDILCAVEGT